MSKKTCGECKYRYAYRDDEDCNGRCKLAPTYRIPSAKPACSDFEPIPPPTNGDVIRQMSDAELAEKFVFDCGDKDGDGYRVWYSSITEMYYFDESEAIAATVAKLKEVCDDTK